MPDKNRQIIILLLLLAGAILINFAESQVSESVLINLGIRNNLWQHYSSKSLKGKFYEIEKNRLALQNSGNGLSFVVASNLGREIERYKKEQAEIQAQAVRYDTLFESVRRKHLNLEIGTVFVNFGFLAFLFLILFNVEEKKFKLAAYASYLIGVLFSVYAFFFL